MNDHACIEIRTELGIMLCVSAFSFATEHLVKSGFNFSVPYEVFVNGVKQAEPIEDESE